MWGEPFALSRVKKLNIINSLFSTENHAVSVYSPPKRCYFQLPSFAHASPRFMSWPHSSLSCPAGKAKLDYFVIWSSWGFQRAPPLARGQHSVAAACSLACTAPIRLRLLSISCIGACDVQRGLKWRHKEEELPEGSRDMCLLWTESESHSTLTGSTHKRFFSELLCLVQFPETILTPLVNAIFRVISWVLAFSFP